MATIAKPIKRIEITEIKNVKLKIDLSATFFLAKSIIIQTGIAIINIKLGMVSISANT